MDTKRGGKRANLLLALATELSLNVRTPGKAAVED